METVSIHENCQNFKQEMISLLLHLAKLNLINFHGLTLENKDDNCTMQPWPFWQKHPIPHFKALGKSFWALCVYFGSRIKDFRATKHKMFLTSFGSDLISSNIPTIQATKSWYFESLIKFLSWKILGLGSKSGWFWWMHFWRWDRSGIFFRFWSTYMWSSTYASFDQTCWLVSLTCYYSISTYALTCYSSQLYVEGLEFG